MNICRAKNQDQNTIFRNGQLQASPVIKSLLNSRFNAIFVRKRTIQFLNSKQFNDIKAKELLDIKQMRHVRGGASGTCGVKVIAGYENTNVIPIAPGINFIDGKYKLGYELCGISYATAMSWMGTGLTSNWCCDNCNNASYCNK